MAREDYSNRTRETLHRNWLFDNTNVIVSGQNAQVKDTFIYNQSWWTKNSDCHNHYYKLQTGVSSGHSHAFPKDREELVLGLMNRIRESHGGRSRHGIVPSNVNYDESNLNPISGYSAWDDNNFVNAFDHQGYENFQKDEDATLDLWYGSYDDHYEDDDDSCIGHLTNSDDYWKINGEAWDEGGATDFRQIRLWDPCAWAYGGDMFREQLGLNEKSHYDHPIIGNQGIGYRWCTEGGNGQSTSRCNENGGVDCYGDFTSSDVGYNAGGRSGDFPGANWMRNQPPSLERTPFRPIILCDLRTDNNPAVPEGGFVRSCKLILTVSKQSVAWPRKGFTAEVFNLSAGATEYANWYSPKGKADSLLDHDTTTGATLGEWYTTLLRDLNMMPWILGEHWLPDPIHKSIFPKETNSYKWYPDEDWVPEGNNIYDYKGISPRRLATQIHWKFDRPHNHACRLTGTDVNVGVGTRYGEHEEGGYHSEQLLAGIAYDGEQSWEGIEHNNECCDWPGQGLPPFKLWEPIPWWVECGWACGNSSYHKPVGNTDGTSPDTGHGVRAVGCSAGNWHARASEVEGLTGCGGAVDVTFGGFTHDVDGPPLPHYAYDGENLNTHTTIPFGPLTHEFLPEWAPISSPNYKEFNIPKFTTTGFSGGNENLFNVEGPHGTGSTAQYDGRGITFTIELDNFARNAILNKEQKLDLLIKGEYKARPPGSTVDAVYESAATLYVKTNEIGCKECVDELHPKSDETSAPEPGFVGIDKTWKTDAAQIATNFFSVDSPAPNRLIPLYFRGKGSTVDWESGLVGSMAFHLQTTNNPNKEEYIRIPSGMSPSQFDAFTRFNVVFGKMSNTDSFEILDSENYGFNGGNTDGTYTPYKVEMAASYTNVYVTGGTRLFPDMSMNVRPETINNQSARFIGTHNISLDGEYYIDTYTDGAYQPMFEYFYDQVESTTPLNPESTAYPEFYSQNAMVEGGGGITGGGRDIIEVNINDATHTNNGTYTIESVYYMNQTHNINIERLKVKEKVTEYPHITDCLVKRVNHRPRFEVTYRSRHQYDRPDDPAGGVPHGT